MVYTVEDKKTTHPYRKIVIVLPLTFTTNALIAHAIGDYILQSDWMANNKTKSIAPAIAHVITYAIPFFLLTGATPAAIVVIVVTHYWIDHLRLARQFVFAKNFLAPPSAYPDWSDCKVTGYPSDRPAWLSVWLLIIADNIMHICINAIALQYF